MSLRATMLDRLWGGEYFCLRFQTFLTLGLRNVCPFLPVVIYITIYRVPMEGERPPGVGVSSYTHRPRSELGWSSHRLVFSWLLFCFPVSVRFTQLPHTDSATIPSKPWQKIKKHSLLPSLLFIPLADNKQIIQWADLEIEMAHLKTHRKDFG